MTSTRAKLKDLIEKQRQKTAFFEHAKLSLNHEKIKSTYAPTNTNFYWEEERLMQEECTLQLEQQKLHLAVLSVNNRENTLKQVLRTKEDGLKEQTRRELQRVLKSQNLSKRQRAKLNDEVEIQVDHIIHLATLQWNRFF
eukprot:TRINITY_DN4402_c0_g1_i13.p2 TRINITY_DN4402_c0_g1~~TRINITY_DN4402_c0_g1_i13.p2  ORF type:complete len:140 (-),score=33.76 TRINITY_DN4402_c0_g1_i13:114-533(-)